MNISDLTIADLFETFGVAIILIKLVKIIYFISLHHNISKNRYEIEDTRKMIKEQIEKQNELNLAYLKQFTTQLERIAKALEEETEPYIIENNDNEFSDNRSSTGNP